MYVSLSCSSLLVLWTLYWQSLYNKKPKHILIYLSKLWWRVRSYLFFFSLRHTFFLHLHKNAKNSVELCTLFNFNCNIILCMVFFCFLFSVFWRVFKHICFKFTLISMKLLSRGLLLICRYEIFEYIMDKQIRFDLKLENWLIFKTLLFSGHGYL